jgi:hypothetical protein
METRLPSRFPRRIERVTNIRVFAEAMERLADLSQAIDAGFDQLRQFRNEMIMEARRHAW